MSPTRSRSPSPSATSASSSRVSVDLNNAPPRASTSAFYEAGVPPTLANNLLHPPRPSNQRSNSWKEILTASGAQPQEVGEDESASLEGDRWDNEAANERTRLLDGDEGDSEPEEDQQTGERGRTARASRSRSRSARRTQRLPWYKRPSPIWLLPGTFIMAISMGLTYAPKLELYTQLICRSMDPAKSKVSIPPPVSTTQQLTFHPFQPQSTSSYTLEYLGNPQETEEERETKKRDQDWANQCHRSSAVQSSVARLALILTLMMGLLSSLTTGWWGSYSDRKGRKPVLILAMFGTVALDSVFLITVNYHHLVSYNFLLLGPILDGLLGGFSTAQATTNAYLSDCTSPGSRARIFSLLAGLMFAGFALGPILSSLLLSYAQTWFNITDPTQIVLIPFYIALSSHLFYLLLLCLGLPESLSESRREASQKRYEEELKLRKEREIKADEKAKEGGTVKVWTRKGARNLGRLFGFLRPLGLLLPRKRTVAREGEGEQEELEVEEELRTNIDWGQDLKEYWSPEDVWKRSEDGGAVDETRKRKGGRDWSLTKIALSYASYMSVVAIISVKLQYANYTFDWSAKEDGLFLSYIGVLRVVALLVFLPLFVRILRRPAPDPIRPKPSETDQVELKKWEKEKKWLKVVTDSHFDLRLARLSLVLDFLGFLAFSLISLSSHPTPVPFLLSTLLQSLGSGASPTLQSLALAHSTPRDSGRLFASFSVVQSIASQVLGPILFGTTFINTVGKGRWSGSVFWVATLLCAISWTCVSSLRLRKVWIEGR
ncbi:uncharacterized protein JCM6883_000266 [Sporobolomyces salmoneus]|uniref:uncharacterized protein n=1 Tax=Sporobolomyces salmoneus TaxID=183962 RepID=UPI00316BA720